MNIQKVLIVIFCVNFFGAFAAFGQLGVIANEKANVFYLGLEYPMSVAVAGVPSQNIVLKAVGADTEIKQTSEGTYTVRPTSTQSISLQVRDRKTDKLYASYNYRVQALPTPTIGLGGKINRGGTMTFGSGQMSAQLQLTVALDNMEIEIPFEIVSYTLYYKKRRVDAVSYSGTGARFSGEIAVAIRSAQVGDTYTFTDIRVKAPGETASRKLNTMTIRIL
jgi:hypothetical protein